MGGEGGGVRQGPAGNRWPMHKGYRADIKSRIICKDASRAKASQRGWGGPWVGASGRYCFSKEQRERDKGVGVSPAPREEQLKQNVHPLPCQQELRRREKNLGGKSQVTRTLLAHHLQVPPVGQRQREAGGQGSPVMPPVQVCLWAQRRVEKDEVSQGSCPQRDRGHGHPSRDPGG